MSDCPDCQCGDCKSCLSILHLILDGEATEQQELFFADHVERCMICFSHYNVEKQLRQLLKAKVKRHVVPEALIQEIKQKVNNI